MKRIALALLALVVALSPAAVSQAATLDIGPPIGSQMPAFDLPNAQGVKQNVASLSGEKGVVLVLFRSAKWCPFCKAQLISLKDASTPLRERGYKLAGISYDPVAVLNGFVQEREINFELLSDDGSKTIDALGLRDPQYKEGHFAYGVPQPGIFIVSPKGVIRAKLAEEGYKTRPSLEAILAAIDHLQP
jgi:peroxiredoxin